LIERLVRGVLLLYKIEYYFFSTLENFLSSKGSTSARMRLLLPFCFAAPELPEFNEEFFLMFG